MFEDFEKLDVKVPDHGYGEATIRLRRGGEGPPLLLLHGNPMSHVTWHKIVPELKKPFKINGLMYVIEIIEFFNPT